MNNMEMCIPSSAVASTDESDTVAVPEPGDTVNFSVEGKVTRVDGDNVYIQPTKVNDEDMPAPMETAAKDESEMPGDADMAQEEDELKRMSMES